MCPFKACPIVARARTSIKKCGFHLHMLSVSPSSMCWRILPAVVLLVAAPSNIDCARYNAEERRGSGRQQLRGGADRSTARLPVPVCWQKFTLELEWGTFLAIRREPTREGRAGVFSRKKTRGTNCGGEGGGEPAVRPNG